MSFIHDPPRASSFGKAKSQEESNILEALQVIERAINTKEPELHEAFQTVAKTLNKAAKEEKLHGAFQTVAKALDKAAKEDKLHGAFESVAAAMLTIATFAAGITFNLLLKPSDPGPPTRAFIFLSYANALFCAALMGCALVKISIELVRYSIDPTQKLRHSTQNLKHPTPNSKHPTQKLKHKGKDAYASVKIIDYIQRNAGIATFILSMETCIVGSILYVAVYLLLYSSSLFLQVSGPLILGSTLYGIFGTLTCIVTFISVFIRNNLDIVISDIGKNEEGSGGVVKLLKNVPQLWAKPEIKADNPANIGGSVEKSSNELKTNQRKEGSADDSKKGNMEEKIMEEGLASMKPPEKPGSGEAT